MSFSALAWAAGRQPEPADAPALVLTLRLEGVADAWIVAGSRDDELRMIAWLRDPRIRAAVAEALERVYGEEEAA